MGITQFIGPKNFYTETSPRDFCPGHICWVPVPNHNPVPMILDVERRDDANHEEVRFFLRNANRRDDFRKKDRSLPVKNLRLRSHEELLTVRAKKRLAIFFGAELDQYPEIAALLARMGKKHIQDDSNFAIPVYSASYLLRPTGIPPEVMDRARYLLYRQFFYLPSGGGLNEAIARFDRTHIIIGKDPAAIEPTEYCLTEEVFALFTRLFTFCLTGIIDKKTQELREIIQSYYEGR